MRGEALREERKEMRMICVGYVGEMRGCGGRGPPEDMGDSGDSHMLTDLFF